MNKIFADTSGLRGFEEMIQDIIDKTGEQDCLNIMKEVADEFVGDLLRLPKPVSRIRAPGYTHLIHTFASRISDSHKDVEVGWGKYYGPMVERGTRRMGARPHIAPTYEKNRNKYEQRMREKFGLLD